MKRQDSPNTGESDAHDTVFSRDFQVPILGILVERNGTRIGDCFEKPETHNDSNLI